MENDRWMRYGIYSLLLFVLMAFAATAWLLPLTDSWIALFGWALVGVLVFTILRGVVGKAEVLMSVLLVSFTSLFFLPIIVYQPQVGFCGDETNTLEGDDFMVQGWERGHARFVNVLSADGRVTEASCIQSDVTLVESERKHFTYTYRGESRTNKWCCESLTIEVPPDPDTNLKKLVEQIGLLRGSLGINSGGGEA